MSKPELPSVNEAAWKKEYIPSGICPPVARFLLFILGPLVGIAVGIAAYYGGFLTSGLASILIKLYVGMGLCAGIFSWVGLALSLVSIVLFLGLGFPTLLGFILSSVIFLIARIGKCRSPKLTTGIGVVSGVLAYGVFAGLAIHFGSLHETSYLTKLLPNLSSTSGWMIFFVILDAIILIASAAGFSGNYIRDNPFCEQCKKWYGKPITASYAVEYYDMAFASQLIRMLESGTPPTIKVSSRLPMDAQSTRITLKLQRCTCSQTDYKLTTTLYWLKTRIEKGQHYYDKDKRITEEESEEWFKTMISPDLGHQLELALFLEK